MKLLAISKILKKITTSSIDSVSEQAEFEENSKMVNAIVPETVATMNLMVWEPYKMLIWHNIRQCKSFGQPEMPRK